MAKETHGKRKQEGHSLRRIRVPERFQKATMDTLDRDQFEMVLDYGNHLVERQIQGMGLALSGPPGVGKSWALAALTRRFTEKVNLAYEFVTAPDLFEQYAPVDGDRISEYHGRTWTDVYNNARWLVINDLGKEYRGGKMHEQVVYKLGRLLRTRVEKKLVTHITMNIALTADDADDETFDSVYGDSVVSLLRESVDSYEVQGADRRQHQKGE